MYNKDEIIYFLEEIDSDFPTPLSSKVNLENYVEKILTHANVIIKRVGSEIAGLSIFYCNDLESKIAYESLLGVNKKHRGKGIAKDLMIETLKVVKNNDFNKMFLYSENQIAIDLYKSLGFSISETDENGKVKMEITF